MSLMLAYKAIYQTSLYVSLNIGKERQKEMIGTVTVRDEELRTQPLEVAEELYSTLREDMEMRFFQVY